MKTACPDCNSPQNFVSKELWRGDDSVETYLICHMCNYRQIILVETRTEWRARKRDRIRIFRALKRSVRS